MISDFLQMLFDQAKEKLLDYISAKFLSEEFSEKKAVLSEAGIAYDWAAEGQKWTGDNLIIKLCDLLRRLKNEAEASDEPSANFVVEWQGDFDILVKKMAPQQVQAKAQEVQQPDNKAQGNFVTTGSNGAPSSVAEDEKVIDIEEKTPLVLRLFQETTEQVLPLVAPASFSPYMKNFRHALAVLRNYFTEGKAGVAYIQPIKEAAQQIFVAIAQHKKENIISDESAATDDQIIELRANREVLAKYESLMRDFFKLMRGLARIQSVQDEVRQVELAKYYRGSLGEFLMHYAKELSLEETPGQRMRRITLELNSLLSGQRLEPEQGAEVGLNAKSFAPRKLFEPSPLIGNLFMDSGWIEAEDPLSSLPVLEKKDHSVIAEPKKFKELVIRHMIVLKCEIDDGKNYPGRRVIKYNFLKFLQEVVNEERMGEQESANNDLEKVGEYFIVSAVKEALKRTVSYFESKTEPSQYKDGKTKLPQPGLFTNFDRAEKEAVRMMLEEMRQDNRLAKFFELIIKGWHRHEVRDFLEEQGFIMSAETRAPALTQ